MADAPSHQSSANRSPVVLLLPQNGQHLETTLILIPELVAHEMVPEVMLMDGVFHQDLDPGLVGGTAHIRQLLVTLDRPFYRMTPLGQVRAILRSVRPMRRAVGHPAVIIAFNDGALQRLAMRLARPAKVAILLDGMISDYAAPTNGLNRVRSLLKGFGRLVRATPAGIILPSDVGLSPADVVFVLGRHSAEVLVSMRSQAAQVVATGLPRWPHATGTDRPSSVRRVLYLTGAFAWHAQHEAAEAQSRDVDTVATACRDLGLELVVRVHPRDRVEAWSERGFAVVTSDDESMETSILGSDLVLAMVSTGLLEAVSLGRIARAVIIADRYESYERSFVADPFLAAIRTATDLRSALTAYRSAIDPAAYDRQQAGLEPYVAASGRDAAERVAAVVADLTR